MDRVNVSVTFENPVPGELLREYTIAIDALSLIHLWWNSVPEIGSLISMAGRTS